MLKSKYTLVLFLFLFLFSCQKEDIQPSDENNKENYSRPNLPRGFNGDVITPYDITDPNNDEDRGKVRKN